MGFKRLEKNLIDIIKEEQAKKCYDSIIEIMNRQNLDFGKKRSVCIIH